MAWFKVDDGFGSNPKVMQIPRADRHACIGLWLMAGVWSAQHLTDGVVPEFMLDELGANVSHRDRLVSVGLWSETRDGVAFNDWHEYQPMRVDVLAAREKERRRKEDYRKKAANKGQSPSGTEPDGDVGHQRVSGHPDPTRPDPLTTSKEVVKRDTAKRGIRLSQTWLPSNDSVAKMRVEAPDVDTRAEHASFIDYWIAQPGQKGVKLNWDSTWRNWMRRKQGDVTQRRGKPTPTQRAQATAALGRPMLATELLEVE